MIHTKSGGGVVVGSTGLILVVSQHGNSWSLPKGHVDPGEDELAAAIRETEEESGITDLTMIKELGSYKRHRIGKDGGEDRTELKTITIYLFTTEETKLKPIDPDNPEARWVGPTMVASTLTHPSDIKFFESVLPAVQEFISNR